MKWLRGWFLFSRAAWRLGYGRCPECNSTARSDTCKVCYGYRYDSYAAPEKVKEKWRSRFLSIHR